jgi:CRP-like cAMP-binding protein
VDTTAARSDLTALDLFSGLDRAAVKQMLGGITAVRLLPGDLIDVTRSDAACWVVRAGRLALDFDEAGAVRHRTVTLLEEGDVLLPASPPWASVGPRVRGRALERSEVLLVDQTRFDEWLTDARIAANLVRVLAAQIADRELAVAIALEPRVERRLLLKLRQLAERFGRVTPQGVRLDLRLTHQQLADMVGAVRESITIALGKLVQNEEITIERRTIWIHTPDDPPE